MCGIGLACNLLEGAAQNKAQLRRMLSRMRHRGEGGLQDEIWCESNFSLGTNRLAITSQAAEGQPYVTSSGRYIFCLNGEIYRIGKRDVIDGVCSTVSDTCVFGEALDQLGPKALYELDGMYALIIVDRLEGTITLCRDRVGIKPLYYYYKKGCLLVASEIKALSSEEVVDEISCVPIGGVSQFNLTSGVLESWKSNDLSRPQEGVGDLFECILDSVNLLSHGLTDVPVLLSGGVDSSFIFACLAVLGKRAIPFVIGGEGSTDRQFGERLARHFNVEPIVVELPSEEPLFRSVDRTVEIVESFEPNLVRQSSLSIVLSQAVSWRGYRVALCGEGADELFGGYPEFLFDPSLFPVLRDRFLRDLHRTQLQRVDRSAMAATLEVRVPYLSNQVLSWALNREATEEHLGSGNSLTTKKALREAARKCLPDWIVDRPKVVFSEGAGLRSNAPVGGMFSNQGADAIAFDEYESLKREFPDWSIATREEARYFKRFAELGYHKASFMKRRVMANRNASVLGADSAD